MSLSVDSNKKTNEFKQLEIDLKEADGRYGSLRSEYNTVNNELIKKERKHYDKIDNLNRQYRLIRDNSERAALKGLEDECDKTRMELAEMRADLSEKTAVLYEQLVKVDQLKVVYTNSVLQSVVWERDLYKKKLEELNVETRKLIEDAQKPVEDKAPRPDNLSS